MIAMLSLHLTSLLSRFGAPCTGGDFLGFPKWYKYLPGETTNGMCTPQLTHLSDIWLIVAAVVEILLRLAGLLAVIFVIYGGVQYVVSKGDPSSTGRAKQTIINALIGLVIAIAAATIVTYLAGRFNA